MLKILLLFILVCLYFSQTLDDKKPKEIKENTKEKGNATSNVIVVLLVILFIAVIGLVVIEGLNTGK